MCVCVSECVCVYILAGCYILGGGANGTCFHPLGPGVHPPKKKKSLDYSELTLKITSNETKNYEVNF